MEDSQENIQNEDNEQEISQDFNNSKQEQIVNQSQNSKQGKSQLNITEQEKSIKSWDLSNQEVKFLQELHNQIQETQILAEGLKEKGILQDEQIDLAQQDIETVQNVIQILKDESDKEDDIRFAIDNALLSLATTKRRTEDDNDTLRTLVRERNQQLRMLVIKVKDQDKQIKQKDEQILNLEKQVQLQSQNMRQLQNKVEDEHRIKIVQEQLRKPKENNNKFYDNSKYVDTNARNDPFDFWQSNAPNTNFEYPGEPKKLNDLISKKQLWVASKEDSVGSKQNKNNQKNQNNQNNNNNFWGM